MRFEGSLDGANHVVARIFSAQTDVEAQYRAAVDVDDDQQPQALDLELLLETQGVAHHDLQSHVKPVAVELHDIECLPRGRSCDVAGHALEVSRPSKPCAAAECTQALGAYHLRQRTDAHALCVEGVVRSGETGLPALEQEVDVQVLQATKPYAQSLGGGGLLDSDALGADLLDDPTCDGRMALQQFVECSGGPGTIRSESDFSNALIGRDARIRHECAPPEKATVFVRRETVIEEAIELPALDASAGLYCLERSAREVEFDSLMPSEVDCPLRAA